MRKRISCRRFSPFITPKVHPHAAQLLFLVIPKRSSLNSRKRYIQNNYACFPHNGNFGRKFKCSETCKGKTEESPSSCSIVFLSFAKGRLWIYEKEIVNDWVGEGIQFSEAKQRSSDTDLSFWCLKCSPRIWIYSAVWSCSGVTLVGHGFDSPRLPHRLKADGLDLRESKN